MDKEIIQKNNINLRESYKSEKDTKDTVKEEEGLILMENLNHFTKASQSRFLQIPDEKQSNFSLDLSRRNSAKSSIYSIDSTFSNSVFQQQILNSIKPLRNSCTNNQKTKFNQNLNFNLKQSPNYNYQSMKHKNSSFHIKPDISTLIQQQQISQTQPQINNNNLSNYFPPPNNSMNNVDFGRMSFIVNNYNQYNNYNSCNTCINNSNNYFNNNFEGCNRPLFYSLPTSSLPNQMLNNFSANNYIPIIKNDSNSFHYQSSPYKNRFKSIKQMQQESINNNMNLPSTNSSSNQFFFPNNFTPNNNNLQLSLNKGFVFNNNSNTNKSGSNNNLPTQKTKHKNKSKSKKEVIVHDFETLEEFLEFLKGGKQIGNYIKCRKNTETMMNLLKKLPNNKITELIQMISYKLKDIIISNNKFAQYLFELCDENQRLSILTTIKDNFVEIALNKWGSFSLQALIKNANSEEENKLILECISNKICNFISNKRANFVLQKIFNNFPQNEFPIILFDEIMENFNKIIYNTLGINLLKNIIVANSSNPNIMNKLMNKLNEHLINILNLSSGSVILITILEKCDYELYTKKLVSEIINNFQTLCEIKTASFVYCKCILISDENMLKNISESFYTNKNLISQLCSFDEGKKLLCTIINCDKIDKGLRNDLVNLIKEINKEHQNENSNNLNLGSNDNINNVNICSNPNDITDNNNINDSSNDGLFNNSEEDLDKIISEYIL